MVAVDPTVEPPGPDTDEAGIVTVGRGIDQHGYVLEDNSGRMAPVHWARAAVAAYHRHNADAVVAEVNNGGELVANQIRAEDPTVKVITVRASRGKVKRAEPIAGLYDRHLVHHVGTLGPGGVWVFAEMESQMLGLTSQGPTTDHDDRVDAVVWGLTELLLEEQGSWKVL